MKKLPLAHVLEITFSCLFAILLSQALGLQNSVSAGIIAILSVQGTKKHTLQLALERSLFFLLALFIAFISFSLLGYSLLAFSFFVFLFSLACYWKKAYASLSICCVLISHFFIAQHMAFAFVVNEALLLIIGVGFGIFFNLFTPDSLAAVRKQQFAIEEEMKTVLFSLSSLMEGETDSEKTDTALKNLETTLFEGHQQLSHYEGNTFWSSSYYRNYLFMRENQYKALNHIFQNAKDLVSPLAQTPLLSAFFVQTASNFHESNNALDLLKELEDITAFYSASPLPQSRTEFEQRATLYRILVEMEQFLELKASFVQNLSDQERKTFQANITKEK